MSDPVDVRHCTVCGQRVADAHFCPNCGAFVDWDPPATPDVTEGGSVNGTQAEPVTTATLVARADPPRFVEVSLGTLDQPPGSGAEIVLTVAAGGRVGLVAQVRNESEIVDSYALRVIGLPDGWWTIDRPTAYLLPLGSSEGVEEDVGIALHPPRAPEALAQRWPVTIRATSESHPTRIAEATAYLEIEPYLELSAAARPAVVRGRRRAALTCAIANGGNTAAATAVTAVDAEDRCEIVAPEPPIAVPPGTTIEAPLAIRPRRPLLLGRSVDHRLEISVATIEGDVAALPALAVYRQRPWIAWWVPFVLLLLALAALLVYLLWPHHVRVPELRHARSAFAAQKRLERSGLTLDPRVRRVVRPKARPGSVVAQTPPPGKEVDERTPVSVVVAAGAKRVEVPKLVKLRVAAADDKLQQAGLTLGAVQPKLDPKGRIASQLPHAGAMRRRGSPVSVVLAAPKKAKDNGKGKKAKAASAGGVPALPAGGGAAAAAAAIAKAGLSSRKQPQLSPEPRGTVLGTVPPPGAPPPADGVVVLLVSAGFPHLAYDADGSTFVVGGVAGKRLRVLGDATVTSGGAWDAEGRRLAFVSHGRLYVRAVGAKKAQRVLLRPGDAQVDATFAAFAPKAAPDVLAFVEHRVEADGAEHDAVCAVDVVSGMAPSCQALDARWRATGVVWRPDGAQVLVPVVAVAPDGPFGLLRFVVAPPLSAAAEHWRGGHRLLTPHPAGRGVRAAAFSPDGKQLAMISNLVGAAFRVGLTDAADLAGKNLDYLPVTGCDVAWRSDGAELAIVQADAGCTSDIGPLVRLRPGAPRTLQTVVLRGRHPSWQPVDLSPGPVR